MTSPAVTQLAVDLDDLTRKVNAKMSPQLGNSSIEDSGINEYDRTGQLGARIGKQYDDTHGAFSLSGPVPPSPMLGSVEELPSALKVIWGGEFAAGVFTVAPMDFARVEVHVGTVVDEDFGFMFSTLRGSFESARGGELVVQGLIPGVQYYVCLTTRSLSGKPSIPSDPAGPFSPTLLPPEEIDVDFDQFGGTTVFYGPTEPDTDKADLWLKPTTTPVGEPQRYITYRYSPLDEQWVELADQGATEAALAAEAAQAAADFKAELFVQPTQPANLAPTAKGIWVETDNGNRSYNWNGGTMTWDSRLLGNGSIQPNSLVASNVIATGTVTAALLESLMVLTTVIFAGPPTAEHVRIDSDGVVAYSVDPSSGLSYASSRFGGPGDDFIGLTDAAGNVQAGMDAASGNFVGQGVTVENGVISRGVDLGLYINDLPRGRVAWGNIDVINGSSVQSATETGDCLLSFTALPGREYRITAGPVLLSSTVATDWCTAVLRYTITNTTPIPNSSAALAFAICKHNETVSIETRYSLPVSVVVPTVVQILLTHSRNFGSGNVYAAGTGGTMQVEDIGLFQPDRIVVGGSGSGGSTPPSVQNYQATFTPVWFHTWNGSNVLTSMGDSLYQGYYSSTGNTKSMIGFPDLTTTLSGATVRGVSLWTYTPHWYNYSGGYPVVGYHPNLANTTVWPSGATGSFTGPLMKRGEARYIELPHTWDDGWRTGAVRGITLGPGFDNGAQYYGYHSAAQIKLVVNYSK